MTTRERFLRDRPHFTKFQSWTPTIAQGVAVSTSSLDARYLTIDKFVFGTFDMTFSSSGTAGSPILVSGLPVIARLTNQIVGSASFILASNGNRRVMVALLNTTTQLGFHVDAIAGLFAQNTVFNVSSGDILRCEFSYEAA